MTVAISDPASASAALSPVVGAVDLDRFRRAGHEAVVVDVRTPAEVEAVHIPGSYNVPLDQLSEHCEEFRGVGDPIVLVCRSGMRARQAEAALQAAGIERLHVLDGGVQAWQQAGLPVVQGRQRWSLERQVRAIAGSLVLVGVLGSLFVWQPLIYLAGFVGAGLLFAGVTDTCMMGLLLLRLPMNRQATCDVPSVLTRLKRRGGQGAP
ncbi:MAG: rhodanese-like domain-containing protein [Chloroflexi bacterium]|nr:rhodanese-like domain-containing protein [Chloroflexota bacterium]